MTTKTDIAKQVVSIVVGIGTSKIVAGVIKNNTDPDKLTDKVAIAAASVVLGGIIAERTRVYTDAQIDKFIESCQKIVLKVKNASNPS